MPRRAVLASRPVFSFLSPRFIAFLPLSPPAPASGLRTGIVTANPQFAKAPTVFDLHEHGGSASGLVSRVSPVHTAVCNCTRDEGGPFEVGNQVLISSHRKLLSSKAMVVNVAEKSGHDLGRQG
jgi:hypothetical protein